MRVLGVIIAALCLGSCGSSEPQVPEAVKQAMATELPDDGQIYVMKAQGRFVIDPETAVCLAPREIDPALKKSAPRFLGPGLGQAGSKKSSGLSGDLGTDLGNGRICNSDDINIINKWLLVRNRQGGPYKLVLAVWQGDVSKGGAVWVGGIERMGELPIKSPSPIDNMPAPYSVENEKIRRSISPEEIGRRGLQLRLSLNIASDSQILSQAFLETIDGWR